MADTPVKNDKKLYVLDTNVLMGDPFAIFRFDEHDIQVPTAVLEELDKHKKGVEEINRNARAASRVFDELMERWLSDGGSLGDGIPLWLTGNTGAKGRLYFETKDGSTNTAHVFDERSNDNKIIELALHQKSVKTYCEVVLISNDINVRVKARIHGLSAEGMRGEIEIGDEDVIPNNVHELTAYSDDMKVEVRKKNGTDYYTLHKRFQRWHVGDFVRMPENSGHSPFYARITAKNSKVVVLKAIRNFSEKNSVYGVAPKNLEQSFALDLLMDPDIDFVALAGGAGTGKTLMSLAADLAQVDDLKIYDRCIFTREFMPMGKEFGYLKGDLDEKTFPWMGALRANLLKILRDPTGKEGERATDDESQLTLSFMAKQFKLQVKPLVFMRGDTYEKTFFIVDEAQNLTQKQAKTLVSRAGAGSKVVFLGNVSQIDTPYLSEWNCGLVQTIHRFRKGAYPHWGYVLLKNAERSRLAAAANELL